MSKTLNYRLPGSVLHFLEELRQHNNREWFQERKSLFLEQQELVTVFAGMLLRGLSSHDELETASGRESLHRIYRDTRFSKDKTPYRTHWSGSFRRAGKRRRGGYYFHIEPGDKSFIGGGFWGPNPSDLRRIRDDIAFDPAPLRSIIEDPGFVQYFGGLQGEQVKSAPRGFDAQHEAIDLLRLKQFLVLRPFSDEEVLSAAFMPEADKTFARMRPFLDYMSEVLSTDVNGLEL